MSFCLCQIIKISRFLTDTKTEQCLGCNGLGPMNAGSPILTKTPGLDIGPNRNKMVFCCQKNKVVFLPNKNISNSQGTKLVQPFAVFLENRLDLKKNNHLNIALQILVFNAKCQSYGTGKNDNPVNLSSFEDNLQAGFGQKFGNLTRSALGYSQCC